MDLYIGWSLTGAPATFTAIVGNPRDANLEVGQATELLVGECRMRKLGRPRVMLTQFQRSEETDDAVWVFVGCFDK